MSLWYWYFKSVINERAQNIKDIYIAWITWTGANLTQIEGQNQQTDNWNTILIEIVNQLTKFRRNSFFLLGFSVKISANFFYYSLDSK